VPFLLEGVGGPTVALQYKGGPGPQVPTFTLRATGTVSAAHESARAGPEGSLSFIYGQRLDPATRLSAGVTATRLDARGAVFARNGVEGFVAGTRDFDANWSGQLSASWRQGDVLSYATPPRPDLLDLARVRTTSTTFAEPRIAYSLEAHTVGAAASLSRTLDEATSLNLGVEWRETTRAPLLYVNRLVSLGVTRQF
jgi:hypothetical protein